MNKPKINGYININGETKKFALWENESKTGNIYYTGKIQDASSEEKDRYLREDKDKDSILGFNAKQI
jgi:hypothetical protein